MDIGRAIGRAWEITWRWKFLWILGFLAALGGGNSGLDITYRLGREDLQNGTLPNLNLPPAVGGLIAGFACLAVIVGIALFVISVMARGGLIAGVAQVEAQGSTTLGQAWAVGQRRFWTLFGIGILMVLPVLLVIAVMFVGIFLIAGGAFLAGQQSNNLAGPIIAGLAACICPSVCLLVVLAAVLAQIRIYAERAAILEDLGWIDAFRRGWQVLRENLGNTIILWIVFIVLGLIIGAIALAITVPIAAPIAVWLGNNNLNSAAVLVPVCGLGLLATVVAAVIAAVLNVFTSAAWTLAYRAMTGGVSTPAPAATTEL